MGIPQSASVLRAFAAERKFLIVTTKAKKPDIQSPTYMEILKELQTMIGVVNDIRVANRGVPLYNHLTTVSEGVAMLGWIAIEPKPADYVTETLSSAQYHGNRVLREYKDKLVGSYLLWSNTHCRTETMPTSNGCKPSTAYSNPSHHTSSNIIHQV